VLRKKKLLNNKNDSIIIIYAITFALPREIDNKDSTHPLLRHQVLFSEL